MTVADKAHTPINVDPKVRDWMRSLGYVHETEVEHATSAAHAAPFSVKGDGIYLTASDTMVGSVYKAKKGFAVRTKAFRKKTTYVGRGFKARDDAIGMFTTWYRNEAKAKGVWTDAA